MDRRLAEAVIASFRDDRAQIVRAQLASFDEHSWTVSKDWLDTSGLALYFLARAKALAIEDVIPSDLLRCLEENHVYNRDRTDDMFGEFVKINVEFQRAKLSYANLKGFTFAPRSYPDPTYRYQHDLDFLMAPRDAEKCHHALKRHGYQLSAISGDTWEFRAGPTPVSSLRDLYKTSLHRSLEVHFLSDKERRNSHLQGDRLSRLQLQLWNGFEFPALSERDKFLAQALHLFKHFQTEWTRTAWMLEYVTCIHSHQDDDSFWREIVQAIEAAPEMKIAIGVATLITCRAFGVAPPPALRSCTIDELPPRVRLWVDRYQDEIVFIEHPGSKLYLLLQDVLSQNCPDWQRQRRGKLFPLHAPQKIVSVPQDKGLRLRISAVLAQVRFIWIRLRFHVAQGLRYKVEAARWKRFVASSQS
jgi:hypothetical protein